MKKILFIINPRSGTGSKDQFKKYTDKHIDKDRYSCEIIYTQYRGHATKLAREADADIIAVAGGDGSVNEIAQALTGTGGIMAIIPCGSGNGLARHLGIPVNIPSSLKIVTESKIKLIDTAILNGHVFTMAAGCGFDSHIADKFARCEKRGLYTYTKLVFKEFTRFKSGNYELTIDGKSYPRNAFMITVSNAEQIGNNARISPGALIDDGLLNVTVLKKFPMYVFPHLAYRLFTRSFNRSRYAEAFSGKKITIRQSSGIAHIDGDCIAAGQVLDIEINPLSLKVIVP